METILSWCIGQNTDTTSWLLMFLLRKFSHRFEAQLWPPQYHPQGTIFEIPAQWLIFPLWFYHNFRIGQITLILFLSPKEPHFHSKNFEWLWVKKIFSLCNPAENFWVVTPQTPLEFLGQNLFTDQFWGRSEAGKVWPQAILGLRATPRSAQ